MEVNDKRIDRLSHTQARTHARTHTHTHLLYIHKRGTVIIIMIIHLIAIVFGSAKVA